MGRWRPPCPATTQGCGGSATGGVSAATGRGPGGGLGQSNLLINVTAVNLASTMVGVRAAKEWMISRVQISRGFLEHNRMRERKTTPSV